MNSDPLSKDTLPLQHQMVIDIPKDLFMKLKDPFNTSSLLGDYTIKISSTDPINSDGITRILNPFISQDTGNK